MAFGGSGLGVHMINDSIATQNKLYKHYYTVIYVLIYPS